MRSTGGWVRVPRAGCLALVLAMAACGSAPASGPVPARDLVALEGKEGGPVPRKIDLPVGADPDFDQNDPLGTLKGLGQRKLPESLRGEATASVESDAGLGSEASTHSATSSVAPDE